MTITAELHDGRVLEFPDGTDPSIVQQTVKKVLGVSPAPTQAQNFAPPIGGLVDQIPIEQAPQQPQPVQQVQQTPVAPRNMLQQSGDLIQRHVTGPLRNAAESVIEPVLAIGGAAAGSTIGGYAGALKEALGGNFGSGQGERTAQQVQEAMSYQPRNPNAQAVLSAAGSALDSSKLAGLPIVGQELPMIAQAAKQQMPLVRGMTGAAGEARAARIAAREEGLANQSRANAGKIEITNRAIENKYKLDPSAVNDTTKNAILSSAAGKTDIEGHMSIANQPLTNKLLAKDLGVPENTPLKIEAFDRVRAKAAKPYAEIEKIPAFSADAQFFDDISNINKLDGLSPQVTEYMKAKAPAIQSAIEGMGREGFTGQDVVTLMKDLRKEANTVLNSTVQLDPAVEAAAIAKKSAAKAIENLVDRQLIQMNKVDPSKGYSDLANRFKKGRETIAKSYVIQGATNLASGEVDAIALGNLAKKSSHLTGNLKLVSEIAAVHPEVMRAATKVGNPVVAGNPLQYGLMGVMGATAGSALGPAGAALGGLGGVVARPIIRNLARKKLMSPGYQARNATMEDLRSLREKLGYGKFEPEPTTRRVQINQDIPTGNLPVLPGAPLLTPDAGRIPPNALQGRSPLPVMSEDLFPIAERYQGTNIPIGTIEAGGPVQQRTPLPTLPTQERGLLSLEDPATVRVTGQRQSSPSMDFPLRQEVLQQPEIVAAINGFRAQAKELKQIADNAINPKVRAQAAADLEALRKEFGAGMRQLGIENAGDATGLNRKLYESGRTQLPVQKTFDPRNQ